MALALQPRTVRELAYRVLERHRESGAWVQELLQPELAGGRWSPADSGLATELVNGVVRRRETLRALLRSAMSRPLEQVEPPLLTLLELGAYQLAFLERVPQFAAVHETVELTRALGQRRWTAIVNGVLRGLTRLLTDEWVEAPGECAIPIALGRCRRTTAAVFPSPQLEPAAFVARAFSLPEWLAARWLARWAWNEVLAIAYAANQPPVLYVRVNTLCLSPIELHQRWREAGIDAAVIDDWPALRVDSAGPVERLPGYAEGWWAPQDLTAMRAALLLNPSPGDQVWDVCAAPGGKTTHLAELVGRSGHVVATDVDASRLDRVRQNAQRLGVLNVGCRLIAPDGADAPPGPFDAILLDAPCSNTGVLHRRPEARWRIQPWDIGELASLQRRLLHAACDRLRSGGRLVYSTCSIEPEENEQVVDTVIQQRTDMQRIAGATHLPGDQGDGGFQALLWK